MKFFLAGQQNFGNRGCEALVRSVCGIVREYLPGAEFLVPSYDSVRDGAQWPGMAAAGGRFVAVPPRSGLIKWWNRAITRAPALLPIWEPRYTPPPDVMDTFAQCDAVLMIGGDVISLDYGPGSLFLWSGLMDAAHRAGRPTMLFAASVGPFDADPVIERYMVSHLRRYSVITVRESASLAYLQRLGIRHAVQVADPAFRLDPEPWALGGPFQSAGDGVLGFNLSPLVADSWQRRHPGRSLLGEATAFLQRVLAETGLSIALVPHVDPLDGAADNSDSHCMAQLLAGLGGPSGRLSMLPQGLNAAQLKHAVGACRYLIAARTHATIAAWSQEVPTVSIAYSVKARGLNQDLFDTLEHVLETPAVDRDTLWSSLQGLVQREQALRALLAQRIPQWRVKAGESGALLARTLR